MSTLAKGLAVLRSFGEQQRATMTLSEVAALTDLSRAAARRVLRTLTALGLTPEEAANLTAFMCGIPIEGAHWSIRQINELLFLRELQRSGRFGRKDGGSRPH